MKLNQAQQLAVETIEGPVMVIAGPGTGKTEIIAQRIANILKTTDTNPDSILALTFTESGAKAMKQRLIATIGETAYYVNILTFHAFCSSVIQEFPDRFAISTTTEPLADLERVEIFQQILKAHDFNYLKPVNQPYFYTGALIRSIQDLKREAVTPEKLKTLIKGEKDKKLPELLKIYQAYQKAIAERGRYDFEDMINLVIEAFARDKSLLTTYQERLQYFLIDEYQDTNSGQNQVINLLAQFWGQEANVFVVGDPSQSIYRFQGASLENAIEFTKAYPKAKVIALEQNYRSHQIILDAAHDLIQKNKLKIEDVVPTAKARLKAQPGLKSSQLQLIKLSSETVEAYWVGQKIKELIAKGTKPEQIAILYRHNQDAATFADMLVKLGVPVEIEGGGNVLTDPVINQLMVLLKAINLSIQNLEGLELFTLMHYPWFKLDALEILKLARQASKRKQSLVDLILAGKAEPSGVEGANQLAQWQQLNLNKFLQAVELMELNRLRINEQDVDIKSGAVSLSPGHKAKGREWEQVFIVKAVDGKWGNNKTRELIKLPGSILTNSDVAKKEKNEDERRLFYVALTRAKAQVYLTFSERYLTGDYLKEVVPSMFLAEIPKKYQETVEPRLAGEAKRVLAAWLEPPQQPRPTVEENDWLKTLVADFRLSATALNTYLT